MPAWTVFWLANTTTTLVVKVLTFRTGKVVLTTHLTIYLAQQMGIHLTLSKYVLISQTRYRASTCTYRIVHPMLRFGTSTNSQTLTFTCFVVPHPVHSAVIAFSLILTEDKDETGSVFSTSFFDYHCQIMRAAPCVDCYGVDIAPIITFCYQLII